MQATQATAVPRSRLPAVRVELYAPVASFRHPFFVTGHQPSFDMPPPSTVHGLCAAAAGAWPDPGDFWFGLFVTSRAKVRDLEHQHITTPLGPGTRLKVPTPPPAPGAKPGEARATTEITVQPVTRDMLFDVWLTLYLPPALAEAFRAPTNVLTLGRSQDLAEVVRVTELELAPVEPPAGSRPEGAERDGGRARIEHTYLPRGLRPSVRFGTTVLLTRHVSEPPARHATFEQYIMLREPVFVGAEPGEPRTLDRVEGVALDELYVDEAVLDDEGFPRGVWRHTLVDGGSPAVLAP